MDTSDTDFIYYDCVAMTKRDSSLEWHTLEFFSDRDNGCALTAFINGDKAHIIADSTNFGETSRVAGEYHRLVKRFQEESADGDAKTQSTEGRADSGVAIEDTKDDASPDAAESRIQQWMIDPVLSSFQSSFANQLPQQLSVQDWYHGKQLFFELFPDEAGQKVEAKQLEASNELDKRMQDLIPSMFLPKYITERVDKPFYNAKELVVVASSDQPQGTPYHPCRVRVSPDADKTLFLKVVDKAQPAPLKRELDVLHRIESRGLHKQMNVPTIEGLVYFDGDATTPTGKRRVMGFLQTDIPSARPLTESLDPDVPQKKRGAWADEAERIKTLLHEHDIIWGDAKSDNFLVDADGQLWIIDFGGSYTEGWVDPAHNETIEGDDEGVGKVANALRDPVANMESPSPGASSSQDDDKNSHQDEDGGGSGRPRKRRAASSPSPDSDAKKAKKDADSSRTYCYCKGEADGDMIACDGSDCKQSWFHFSCAGLEQAPSKDEKWFCKDCGDDD